MFPCSSEKEALRCDGLLLPVVFAPWIAAGRKGPGLVQGYGCRVQTSLGAHSETSTETEKPDSWEAAASTALQETIILVSVQKMSRCGAQGHGLAVSLAERG